MFLDRWYLSTPGVKTMMTTELPSRGHLVLLFSVVFALVPIGLCYLARWSVHRGRAEPPWTFPLLMLAGGAGGLVFTAYGYAEVERLFTWLYGADIGSEPLAYEALLCPAAEELGKVFILLAFSLTSWYRGPVDGLLYGFAAGAGFACAESFMYFAAAFEHGGTAGWAGEVVARAAPSAIIHGGATAAFGAFVGAARFDGRRSTAIGALFCGFVAAMLIHGGWNLLIALSAQTGELWYHQLAMLMLTMVVLALIAVMVVGLRLEVRLLKRELSREVQAGRLSEEELGMLVDPRRRRQIRGVIDRNGVIGYAITLGHALRRLRREGRGHQQVTKLRRALARARTPLPHRPG
jgi:RsiW-degrading membrane proteinase PrsW (M82 family)